MLKDIVTDINANEIAIMRTDEKNNESDIGAYIDNGEDNDDSIPVLNKQGAEALHNIQIQAQADQENNDQSALDIDADDEQQVLSNPDNVINGLKDGYIDLPYSSNSDITVENYGNFLHYQTEDDYASEIQDDCDSTEEELGEMLYKSLNDEYNESRLDDKNGVYYNTLKSLDNIPSMDSYGNISNHSMSEMILAHKLNGIDDNITIHAHNNAKSRQHISKLIKLLNPGFYKEWKTVLEPKAIKMDNKINA